MSVISPTTRLLLALSMLKGVGPATLKKVSQIPCFSEHGVEDLAVSVPQIKRALLTGSDWQIAQESAAKQVEDAERYQARIISPFDLEYPKLLAATKDDPFILYVQGSLAKYPDRSVTIIGTREPTEHGNIIATRITQFFAERGWSIVSGLAIGCDSIAHNIALDAGCHTVAVLAHGLHMIAPAKHKKLAQDILASGGALISEYPFGQSVQKQQYVKRDRTQAGMSQGVVMIQSDVQGGSLHASRASLDYGRWLAIPYPTDRDRKCCEPKVQANLLIAEGIDTQRAELLRCPESSLKHVIILRSREDYLRMTEFADKLTYSPPFLDECVRPINAGLSFNESTDLLGEGVEIKSQASKTAFFCEQKAVESSHLTVESCVAKGLIYTPHEMRLRRRVVTRVGTARLSDLKIMQIPPTDSKAFHSLVTLVRDVDAIFMLSARLQRLQMKVDLVNEMNYERNRDLDKNSQLLIQLLVEDVIIQMKRVLNVLVMMNQGRVGESVYLDKTENGDVSFVKALSCLLDSFPESVVFEDGSHDLLIARGDSPQICEKTDIYLDDVVQALNGRVSKIIHGEDCLNICS